MIECRFCGKPFVVSPYNKRKMFCSTNCRKKYDWHKDKPLIKKECAVCGNIFDCQPGNRSRQTCTYKCGRLLGGQKSRECTIQNDPAERDFRAQDAAFSRAMTAAGYAMSNPVRDYTPARLTPLGTFAPDYVRQHATIWPSTGKE